jgi:hypothetical protein
MTGLERRLRDAVEGLDVITPPDLVSRSVTSAVRRRQRRRVMGRTTALAAAVGVSVLAGTWWSSGTRPASQVLLGPTTAPPTTTATRPATTPPGCPTFGHPEGGGYAAVGYIDFLQAHGRQYIAGMGPPARVTPGDLGTQDLIIRCSYAAVNDSTGQVPQGPIRDGDAGYLVPGTPVFAINGWRPTCRLAAKLHGELHVYLAYLPDTTVATIDPCALH